MQNLPEEAPFPIFLVGFPIFLCGFLFHWLRSWQMSGDAQFSCVFVGIFANIYHRHKTATDLILPCNNDGQLGFNLLSPLSLEHCLVHNNRVIRCTIPIAIIHNCSWLWRESCRWWFLVKPKPTMTIYTRERETATGLVMQNWVNLVGKINNMHYCDQLTCSWLVIVGLKKIALWRSNTVYMLGGFYGFSNRRSSFRRWLWLLDTKCHWWVLSFLEEAISVHGRTKDNIILSIYSCKDGLGTEQRTLTAETETRLRDTIE